MWNVLLFSVFLVLLTTPAKADDSASQPFPRFLSFTVEAWFLPATVAPEAQSTGFRYYTNPRNDLTIAEEVESSWLYEVRRTGVAAIISKSHPDGGAGDRVHTQVFETRFAGGWQEFVADGRISLRIGNVGAPGSLMIVMLGSDPEAVMAVGRVLHVDQ
jgi:hypothetical protein